MITSLIDLLRDCLPIHAAWSGAEQRSRTKKGEMPRAAHLRQFMLCQGPGEAAAVGPQPVPSFAP
jgi:hypothetical protein